MSVPTLVARPPVEPSATPAPAPAAAPGVRVHLVGRLAHQLTPADVHDLLAGAEPGTRPVIVVDARFPETFAIDHLPGAVSMPWRTIDRASTASFPRDALIVVYCWNPKCHASTKAASRFDSLGFEVKEMPGGLESWRREGFPTERGERG